MNKIKESSLGDIKSVFNDNAINTHYYRIIHKAFNGIIKNLEFAKPIIQANNGIIIWQTNQERPFLNYVELSEDKKHHIDALIKDSLNEMSLILSNNPDKVFLDDIIEIPNEDAIFFTKDSNNNINVIITEWGYVKDEHVMSEGVLKKIFSTSMKSFIIKFVSTKDKLLEGINVFISTEDFSDNFTSNTDGLVKLNNLKKADTITITSLDNNFEEVKIKVNSTEEYTIIVERTFKLSFKVIDSENRQVKNQVFNFISENYPDKQFITDSNGFYNFQHPENPGKFQVFSVENNELISEKLSSRDEIYTIVYNPPLLEKQEAILDSKKPVIELEFLNWRRRPITNQKIDLYGLNGKTTHTTNNSGIVHLETLNENVAYAVFMNYKGSDWKKEFIHKEATKHTFIVKMKRVLWWWMPFMLFFLLLLLIPINVTHNYVVLDKNMKKPIESAIIAGSKASVYKVQNYNNLTDSTGKININYGKYKLYEQIFKKYSTDIFVSKTGYENLKAKVPLGYFKTRKSIIYLNKLLPETPKIDDVKVDCNSGGDAHRAGGNSIREFDLKQNKGEFVFQYDTGNVHADIIRIYDGPRNKMDDKPPIWQIDEASGRTKFVNIAFTNRIITIEVIGGGNEHSVWQYLVECP